MVPDGDRLDEGNDREGLPYLLMDSYVFVSSYAKKRNGIMHNGSREFRVRRWRLVSSRFL